MECAPTTQTEVKKSSPPKLETIAETNESSSKVTAKSDKLKYLDQLIQNLEVIGNINEYDKLTVDSNNQISIDTLYYTQGIVRRLYGNGRDATLTGLTKLVTDTFKFTDELLLEERNKRQQNMLNVAYDIKANVFDNKMNNYKDTSTEMLNRISAALGVAATGLQNLKITYVNDNQIGVQLDLLISKMEHRVDTIKKTVKNQRPF